MTRIRTRSRPAVGVRINGTWYFDIHAASIRRDSTPNPHVEALMTAISEAVPNEPWRALGDFNSYATSFRSPVTAHTYYATRNGEPDGEAVTTQKSGYPLDFMVANDELTDLAVSVSSGGGSDHQPVRFAPSKAQECSSDWTNKTLYTAAPPRRPRRRQRRVVRRPGRGGLHGGQLYLR